MSLPTKLSKNQLNGEGFREVFVKKYEFISEARVASVHRSPGR